MEYATAFLNNAQNEADIENGTKLMKLYGIRISSPKFRVSKWDYFFDKTQKTVYKGLSSVKFMSKSIANGLYDLSRHHTYSKFIDLLTDIYNSAPVNSRQIDILIKIDYFSDFGNQRELLRICEIFEMFKRGMAKQMKKSEIDGTPMEEIVRKYANDKTKNGDDAKNYTLLDIAAIMRDCETAIKNIGMPDLSDILKVKNFFDIMGYTGYVSGNEQDRRKLFVKEVYPLKRKKDGAQFGYSIITQSIGSGVEGRFTVFNRLFHSEPIRKDDIILCTDFSRDGPYFILTGYTHI